MNAQTVLTAVMAAFALLGAADRIIGNRFGLGKAFEEGISSVGPLCLSMVGMICLSPVLTGLLRPFAEGFFGLFGADPAMLGGMLLACDMGGAPLAESLANDPDAGRFAGYIVSSMMGVTVVFTIPAAMELVPEGCRERMLQGVLCGVAVIPVGCVVGGLTAGYSLRLIACNTLPVLLLSGILAAGLRFAPRWSVRILAIFGKGVAALITVGLGCGIFTALTGVTLIPGMTPIREAFASLADIVLLLAGAFPLITALKWALRTPMRAVGRLLGINGEAVAGLLSTLANSIPTFSHLGEMDARGQVLNMAFAVSAAFVFGDHLGYTAGMCPSMTLPLIAAKLSAGLCALPLACRVTKPLYKLHKNQMQIGETEHD